MAAFDICPRAVHSAAGHGPCRPGVDVDVHLGSWARAVKFGPFDVVDVQSAVRAARHPAMRDSICPRMSARPAHGTPETTDD